MLGTALLLAVLAGCGERAPEPQKKAAEPTPVAKAQPAAPASGCTVLSSNPMPAAVRSADVKDGWTFVGKPFDGQKPGVPMGRNDNQLAREFAVPGSSTRLKITLPVSSDADNGAVILDVIWSGAAGEVGRSAPSVAVGPDKTESIREEIAVPAGATQVVLVARPWRQQDGVLTLGAGELAWCK
jgi:hypothetical protein